MATRKYKGLISQEYYNNSQTIYQWIIATRKLNPIFLYLINFICNLKEKISIDNTYLLLTYDFYRKLSKLTKAKKIRTGLNKNHYFNNYNFYLFKEICTKKKTDCPDGLDRYDL